MGLIKQSIRSKEEQINQSEYGAHYLLIYPELRVLRELYTQYMKTQLEDENKIVLMLPHYETADNLRKILSEGFSATEKAADNTYTSSIDLKKYEKTELYYGMHLVCVNFLDTMWL